MKTRAAINTFLKQRFKNNPFLSFILILLFLTSLLKALFYYYNYSVLFDSGHHDGFKMAMWSLAYDLLTILILNVPFLFLLIITKKIPGRIISFIIRIIFCALNTFMLVLNAVDIFYYRFHLQRSNIDLVYVIDHPFQKLTHIPFFLIAGSLLFLLLIIISVWKIQHLFFVSLMQKANYKAISFSSAIILIIAIKFSSQLERRLVPTYPLIDLDNKELSLVQNSMHTFIYSLYRNNHSVLNKHYFPDTFCDSSLKIKKVFTADQNIPPKNVVLFIMESVPKDFFDSSGIFKVRMPFFDSLLHHSTFFSNAYSYGLESNKGITSILAGIPTLTDIPLYHSSFINLPKTSIGKALKSKNYSSFFCIGDTYDNFGFAKCVYWLGFDKYYCDKDIPGYKKLPYGPMGIYDEYVFQFMHKKINLLNSPFLAVNYNTTTHFPNTLPPTFKEYFPSHYTDAMKSMAYYDSSLHQFFNESKNESWFANTVFIFCSDHWMSPDDYVSPFNNLTDFGIPIIIYDPSANKGEKDTRLASQFDVLGTILGISGYRDTVITYGTDLLNVNKSREAGVVYNRVNNSLYQVNDGQYVLGFNVANDKTAYLYNYKLDKELRNNLLNNHGYSEIKNSLEDKIKIFFQKAIMQYFDKPIE